MANFGSATFGCTQFKQNGLLIWPSQTNPGHKYHFSVKNKQKRIWKCTNCDAACNLARRQGQMLSGNSIVALVNSEQFIAYEIHN